MFRVVGSIRIMVGVRARVRFSVRGRIRIRGAMANFISIHLNAGASDVFNMYSTPL